MNLSNLIELEVVPYVDGMFSIHELQICFKVLYFNFEMVFFPIT